MGSLLVSVEACLTIPLNFFHQILFCTDPYSWNLYIFFDGQHPNLNNFNSLECFLLKSQRQFQQNLELVQSL